MLEKSPTAKTATLTFALSNKILITFSLCAAVVLFLPTLIHQQFITGPVVNATLLIAASFLGVPEAMMLGMLPSTVALASGLLPVALAAVVPFIMISNGLYIWIFHRLSKKNMAVAIVVASVVKFAFLYFLSQRVLLVLLPAKFSLPVAQMMSWPQLITALAGGFMAGLVIKK